MTHRKLTKKIQKIIREKLSQGLTANGTYEFLKANDYDIGRNSIYRYYKTLEAEQVINIEDIDKERAQNDFWYYADTIVKREFDETHRKGFYEHIHGEWLKWYNECKSRLRIILVPRGTFKTTFFTKLYSSWRIGKNPNIRIVIINAVADNAYEMVTTVKQIIESDTFKCIFGDIVGNKNWRTKTFTVKRDAIISGATISAYGIDSNIASKHCDLMIWDDLHAERNTKTLTLIESVKKAFKQSLQVLDPNSEGLIIGTRWNEYDVYQYMLSQMKDVFSLDDNVYLRSAYNEDGSLYFPELLSEEYLEQKRNEIKDDRIYTAFYLNDPKSSETATFECSDFRYFNSYPENCYTYLIIDPAYTKHRKSNETGFIILKTTSIWVELEEDKKARHRQIYVCRAWGDKLEPEELVNKIIDLYQEWKPQFVAIESYGINTILSTYIKEVQSRRGIHFPIKDVRYPSLLSKQDRIQKLLYYYKQNRFNNYDRDIRLPATIYHYKNNKKNYCTDLEDQLIAFRPYQERLRVDVCDALAYFPLVVSYPSPKVVLPQKVGFGRTIDEIERILDKQTRGYRKLGWQIARA